MSRNTGNAVNRQNCCRSLSLSLSMAHPSILNTFAIATQQQHSNNCCAGLLSLATTATRFLGVLNGLHTHIYHQYQCLIVCDDISREQQQTNLVNIDATFLSRHNTVQHLDITSRLFLDTLFHRIILPNCTHTQYQTVSLVPLMSPSCLGTYLLTDWLERSLFGKQWIESTKRCC
jgi:hypothetical protein